MKTKFKSQVSCFFTRSFCSCCLPAFLCKHKKTEANHPGCMRSERGASAHPPVPGGGTRRVQDCRSRTPWLGAMCCDPAGAQHPPAPLTPSPVPPVPPGSSVSVHRQCRPWRSPRTDAIVHVLFSPSLFTDRQQCLPAHPDPLQTGGSCSWRRDAGGGFWDALRSRPCGRPEERSLVYPAVAFLAETPRLNSARGCMERSGLLAAAICVRVEISSPFHGRRTDVRAAKGRNVARILQPAKPGRFLSGSYFQCHIICW